MPTPKKRFKPRKVKRRVVISQKAQLIKKGVLKAKYDTIPNAPTQMPRDNGINMRIKIKRKR